MGMCLDGLIIVTARGCTVSVLEEPSFFWIHVTVLSRVGSRVPVDMCGGNRKPLGARAVYVSHTSDVYVYAATIGIG